MRKIGMKKGLLACAFALGAVAKEVYQHRKIKALQGGLEDLEDYVACFSREQMKLNEKIHENTEKLIEEMTTIYEHMEELANITINKE